MKKVKQYLYINDLNQYLNGNYSCCFSLVGRDDLSLDGYVLVGEINLTVSMDKDKAVQKILGDLDGQEERVRQEMRQRLAIIEQARQELLALEAPDA